MIVPVEHGVLLTGSAIDAVRLAIELAQSSRARNGLPPSTMFAALHQALSPSGQAAITPKPTEESSSRDRVPSVEAAQLLGCSPRQARRLAPLLGGERVGGRWLLDRQAITEHKEGRETWTKSH
jgi:hypothetical protein